MFTENKNLRAVSWEGRQVQRVQSFQRSHSWTWSVHRQTTDPLLVGAVVDWNLSNDLFIEEIYMNNTVDNLFQNAKFKFNKRLKNRDQNNL